MLVDKDSIEKPSTAAPASPPPTSSTIRRRSARRRPSTSSISTRPTQLLDKAGWKKGADGIREKDGKKLKFVYQTSINQPRQKTQAIVKQACQKAGIDIELKAVSASVFFSSDVANPDTYPKFYADLQMFQIPHERSPIPTSSCASYHSREVARRRTSGRAATSRAGTTRSTTPRIDAARTEMDPVKRAAL